MPASEVMSLYRQHKLHSGPGGPIVKSKKQATAIQISLARKEGHHIPEVKGSFQHGGVVPETGDYKVHQGEQIARSYASHMPKKFSMSPDIEDRRDVQGIAARTRAAEESEWREAMKPHAPYELAGPPPVNDPHYAVEGLKGAVAERMHQQGIKGSFAQGGTVPETGDYQVHRGEQLVPDNFYAGATSTTKTWPQRDEEVGVAPDIGAAPAGMPPALGTEAGPKKPSRFSLRVGGGSDDNPYLRAMQSNVASPLHRVEGFKHGGTIPRTGIYRLHRGEQVIPASLASRYRKEKHGS